jgi:hypothetical protein
MTDAELLAHLEARDRCWRGFPDIVLTPEDLEWAEQMLARRRDHAAAAVEGLRQRGGVFRLPDGREFYLSLDGLGGIVRHNPHDGYHARRPSAVRLTDRTRRNLAALNARRFGTTNGRT